jgi:hypothetical protein
MGQWHGYDEGLALKMIWLVEGISRYEKGEREEKEEEDNNNQM